MQCASLEVADGCKDVLPGDSAGDAVRHSATYDVCKVVLSRPGAYNGFRFRCRAFIVPKEHAMNKLLVIVLTSLLLASTAYATDPGCEAKAAEKKLSGAAKNSFITKCQKDAAVAATAACEAQAAKARRSSEEQLRQEMSEGRRGS